MATDETTEGSQGFVTLRYRINVGRRVSACTRSTDNDLVLAPPTSQNARAVRGRWLIVGIAVVAAAAFAISVQGGRWWSVAGVDGVEIGPFGAKSCFGGDCKSAGLGWTGGTERWMRTGTGAGTAGLLSMLTLLIVAAGAAARRVPRLAAKVALVSIATAAVTGALFAIQLPSMPSVEVDRGLALFAAAIVLGAAGVRGGAAGEVTAAGGSGTGVVAVAAAKPD